MATFAGVTLAGVLGTSYQLKFTSNGLTDAVSGNVTPSGHGTATQLAITTQPAGGQSGKVLATQPVVTLRDSAGNTATGSSASVAISIQSGSNGTLGGTTTLSASGGVATFSNVTLAGTVGISYVLAFSSVGLAGVTANGVTVTPGDPTTLALTTQPVGGASGAALTTQPVVTIRDAQGNTVTGSTAEVTVAINSGLGGTLGGTLSINAVNGLATFSGVTLAGVLGTNYQLRFNSSGLTQAVSGNVTPSTYGVATQLAVTTQPVGGQSGKVLTTQPVVTVRDSAGNTVANSAVAVTIALPSGSNGTLGGTLTVNASSGVVTYSGVTLAGLVGTNYVLGFSSTGLTAASANAVTVTPGDPSKVTITTQPVAGASAVPLTQQPVVEIQDLEGNKTSSTASVTVAIFFGIGGALTGTTSVNAVDGVATFTNLVLTGIGSQQYVLRFQSGSLTHAQSNPIEVTMKVVSITRVGSSPSSNNPLVWKILFTGALSGVSPTNFSLTGSPGATITGVTGSGAEWFVSVDPGTAV